MITLYKYRPFNDHLKPVIMSQKIWFPARAKLNDPEDLELKLVEDVDAEVYHQFLLKKADQDSWSRKHLKYNVKKGFTPKGDLTSGAKRKIACSQAEIQKYFDGLGICSLSEKENDPMLWERYGDKNRGVCLVFKMELSEYLLRVEYKTPRPQPKLSVLLLSDDADQELKKVLRTKTRCLPSCLRITISSDDIPASIALGTQALSEIRWCSGPCSFSPAPLSPSCACCRYR